VADEVQLVRTKYSTLTVFKKNFLKFLLRSESGNILLFFKIMFPEQENNIFDCNLSNRHSIHDKFFYYFV